MALHNLIGDQDLVWLRILQSDVVLKGGLACGLRDIFLQRDVVGIVGHAAEFAGFGWVRVVPAFEAGAVAGRACGAFAGNNSKEGEQGRDAGAHQADIELETTPDDGCGQVP